MRQAIPWLALVAASVVLLGCGSDETPEVSAASAGDLTNKLDEIQERVDRQDCPAADDALASLSAAVPEIDANQRFRDDFSTLLTDLDEQIASQCSAAEADASTSSTTSTDENEDTSTTSSTTTTTTTTTDEISTTDETKEEPSTTTTDEPTAPEPTTTTPSGGGSGGSGSGGIAPGSFETDRNGRGGP